MSGYVLVFNSVRDAEGGRAWLCEVGFVFSHMYTPVGGCKVSPVTCRKLSGSGRECWSGHSFSPTCVFILDKFSSFHESFVPI